MNEAAEHDTVLDTGAEQLGKTYARALIGAAQSAGIADKIIEQLGSVVDECLAVSPQLRAAFASPQIDDNEKIKVIDRLFGESCDPLLVKFLKVMAGRGRLAHVDAVRAAADTIHDEMLGRLDPETTRLDSDLPRSPRPRPRPKPPRSPSPDMILISNCYGKCNSSFQPKLVDEKVRLGEFFTAVVTY